MTEYLLLSRAFRVGREVSGNHSGIVVAAKDAFYFVIGRKGTEMGLEASCGALGGLLSAWLRRRPGGLGLDAPPGGVIETNLSALPAEITAHHDWPVRRKDEPLLIITRDAVRSLRYSFWQWGIFLQVEDLEFRIEPPFFGREKALKWLEDAGWPLERTPKKS